MKYLKMIPVLLLALIISSQVQASNETTKDKKTAESVFDYANEMETFNAELLKAEIKELSIKEKRKLINMAIKDVKRAERLGLTSPSTGLYILAIFIPPLAVGLYTDWGMETLYNLVWTFVGGVPGIIHAFIVFGR